MLVTWVRLYRQRLVWGGLASLLLMLYAVTIAPDLSWANQGTDGGDLISAAAILGVAHPTGYPTYLLLAHLFQWLPWGTLAFRTNLLSALSATLAAMGVAVFTARCYPGKPRFAYLGGLTAGLAFGLSPLLWSQAVITEVYTLQALCIALLLGLSIKSGPRSSGWPRMSAGLMGVALGNHLTTLLLMPPWLVLTAPPMKGQPKIRRWAETLMWLAGGLLIYLYLPLRAWAKPVINWGDASTWHGFWWVISAQPYRGLLLGETAIDTWGRLHVWARLSSEQFGWLGLSVALYGIFFGQTFHSSVKWFTGWIAVVFSAFAIVYATHDSYVYLLPVFLSYAVWLGLGAATMLESLSRYRKSLGVWLANFLFLSLLINAVRSWTTVDASQQVQAASFGRAVMAQAPPRAIIFTSEDRDSFSLWYFHYALGERPDLVVIVERLLVFDWYHASLKAHYPDLRLPVVGAGRSAVAAINQRPICKTILEASTVLTCDP